MGKQLTVGDKVTCRYFNKPDGKFYGDYFSVVLLAIDRAHDMYEVRRENGYIINVHRKEILRRIK